MVPDNVASEGHQLGVVGKLAGIMPLGSSGCESRQPPLLTGTLRNRSNASLRPVIENFAVSFSDPVRDD